MPVIRAFKGEKMLGTFGALGGTIDVHAVPVPSRYAYGLMMLAGYIDDTVVPMLAAKRIAREDMQRHFDQDTDPEGDAWLPLDPEYLIKKAKHPRLKTQPENILTLSTDLERSATSDAAWITTDRALFFSTKGLPAYWDVHQSGSDSSGMSGYASEVRRRAASGDNERLPDDPKGGRHTNMGIGRGQATPPRPFIGLSAEATGMIIEMFDLWFDEGIKSTLFVHPRTGVVQQKQGGRFGVKMFPNWRD